MDFAALDFDALDFDVGNEIELVFVLDDFSKAWMGLFGSRTEKKKRKDEQLNPNANATKE